MRHRHIHAGAGVITGFFWGFVALVALIASGCGSSGGGSTSSTASGLTVADTLSAVTAKSGSGSASKPSAKGDGLGKPGESEKPSGKIDVTPLGQYASDRLSSYVREDTREALSTPNGILCLMAQTGYDQMVNKGDYIALVDTDSCFDKEGDNGSSSSTGESSGASETANLDTAVLNVSRPDSASAQTVKMWLDIKTCGEGGTGCRVFGRMVVDAGKSAANPWGLFATDFKGKLLSSDGTLGAARFNGKFDVTSAAGGQVALVYREVEGDVTGTPTTGQFFYARAARALLSIDTATGEAVSGDVLVSIQEKGNFGQGTFSKNTQANVAYNATTFLSSVIGGAITSYDRTKFTYNIWRYGLYNVSDGSRVTRNSGFPIKTASGGYGNLGYWGLWIDRSAPASDSATGATITKQSFSGTAAAETFTIVAGPGKLMKRTKKTLKLNDLTSVPMEYSCGDPACGASLGSQFQVQWDGTNLVKKYVRAQGTQGQQWAPASGNLTLPRDWNTFWVQGLSGNATILTSSLSGTLTSVIFHEETNVTNLQTANLPLFCTGGCLKANITQAQADAGCQFGGSGACQQDPRSLASIFYNGSPYAYLFSFGDLTLYTTTAAGAASAPVKTVAAVTAITGQNQWGFRTRGMVLSSTGMTNPWDSFNQDAVYEWETGPNQWNRYITAKDGSGKLVSFEPPIRVVYAHTTANDVNGSTQYNGASFQLEYSGFGQLYGFPWVPGADGTHGGPAFGLRDGVVINPGAAKEFKVRALNMEQTMQAATSSGTLKITALTPPVVTLVAVDDVIGARPTVTTAPAFIKGVAQ